MRIVAIFLITMAWCLTPLLSGTFASPADAADVHVDAIMPISELANVAVRVR
jgi:hypothetical protein